MAIRLLPFRQYAEEDVVNLFANTAANNQVSDSGDGDAGVFVKVNAGDFSLDPVQYETNSYLGKTDYPFIGRDQYPVVPLNVAAASAGDSCVGVTLLQTAQYDENDEKLLYYPQKKLETQSVLSGEAVPVLGKGIVTLDSASAVDGSPSEGHWLTLSSNAGKVTGVSAYPTGTTQAIGQVLATGNRVNRGVAPDQFAGASVGTGAANTSGAYIVARINC
jgi:hypothetical protein